jgi:hypothetical protein
VFAFEHSRQAKWPEADFILGNPPYIGARIIRSALPGEYVDALRAAYPEIPDTADLVMYWWHKAAERVAGGKARRFGLITTNSIVQGYSRPVMESWLRKDVRLLFAIPDHPWVESVDGADVRIAMTVAARAVDHRGCALLGHVLENASDVVAVELMEVAEINSSLTGGADARVAAALISNSHTCFQGVVPAGDGFKLDQDDLRQLHISPTDLPPVVREYVIGRDLVQRRERKWIIDFPLCQRE